MRIRYNSLAINDRELISNEVQSLLMAKNIGLNIHIHDRSYNKRSVILFLHGNSTSMNVFAPLLNYFSKSYRVIALDLPGHGESFKFSDMDILTNDEKGILAKAFYNPFAMVAIIKQILEKLNIDTIHIIGWSLGGHLAYMLAQLFPNSVKSIISIASPPVYFLYTHKTFREGFIEHFPDVIVHNWINNPTPLSIEDAYASAKYSGFDNLEEENKFFITDAIKSDPLMRKYLFDLSGWEDHFELLNEEEFVKNAKLPIMLMVSSADAAVKAEFIGQYADQFANKHSEVKIVNSNKHATFLHETLFITEVQNFLDSIE